MPGHPAPRKRLHAAGVWGTTLPCCQAAVYTCKGHQAALRPSRFTSSPANGWPGSSGSSLGLRPQHAEPLVSWKEGRRQRHSSGRSGAGEQAAAPASPVQPATHSATRPAARSCVLPSKNCGGWRAQQRLEGALASTPIPAPASHVPRAAGRPGGIRGFAFFPPVVALASSITTEKKEVRGEGTPNAPPPPAPNRAQPRRTSPR